MKHLLLVATLLGSSLLAGCQSTSTREFQIDSNLAATEAANLRQQVIEIRLNNSARVKNTAHTIMTANADMCGDKVGYHYPIEVSHYKAYDKKWRGAYAQRLGLDLHDRPTVTTLTPMLSYASDVLQPGDIILQVDGKDISKGKKGVRQIQKALRKANKNKAESVQVRFYRAGVTYDAEIAGVYRCDLGVFYVTDDTINAFADGENIYFTQGMMDFIRSDEELAYVLAHEVAHNSMRHIEAKMANARGGAFFGLLLDIAAAAGGVDTGGAFTDAGMQAGAAAYSVEFEQEADYVGMYMLDRAGYETAGAADMWRRMAVRDPRGISYVSTHPSFSMRTLALEETSEEISLKKQAGVTPTMKDDGNS